MLFKNISIINENLEIQKNMYVGVKDDKINYIAFGELFGVFADLCGNTADGVIHSHFTLF